MTNSQSQLYKQQAKRFRLLSRIRPAALSSVLLRVLAPSDRRGIVTTDAGLRLYIDPLTHLGQRVLESGEYEPDTEHVIREHLRPGHTFLDIGANEGYFSAVAARVVGAQGYVIAVEPQARLCDIIEINLRLNAEGQFRVFNNAIGGDAGTSGTIHLWPSLNTGASSILAKYRFSSAVQAFEYITLNQIFDKTGRHSIDLVKIDVEGFEGRVVPKLLPHVHSGRIRNILLDYHGSILRAHGFDSLPIHQSLVAAGCDAVPDHPKLNGYVLYRLRKSQA